MPKKSKRAGMTIVEVMIAVLILAFCITGICLLIMKSRELTDVARDHYTAVNIAKNRVERIKTFSYDEIDSFIEVNAQVNVKGDPDGDGLYRRTTTATVVRDGLKEVVVAVEIMNRKRWMFEGDTETLRTYIADIPGAPE